MDNFPFKIRLDLVFLPHQVISKKAAKSD